MPTSEFFQSFDPAHPQNAEFVLYTKQLGGLDAEGVDALVAELEAFATAPATHQQQIVTSVSKAVRRPHAATAYLLRAAEEFLRYFADRVPTSAPDEQEARAIAADLREAGIIQDADEPITQRLLERVAREAADARVRLEAQAIQQGYHPYFDRVEATVELRAVYADDRNAQPAAYVSVASIFIELDEGPQKRVYFQIDRAGLQELLLKLQGTAERMRYLDEVAKHLNTTAPDVAAKIAS